jgi:hypothetical protein
VDGTVEGQVFALHTFNRLADARAALLGIDLGQRLEEMIVHADA